MEGSDERVKGQSGAKIGRRAVAKDEGQRDAEDWMRGDGTGEGMERKRRGEKRC
jgi:hypothetical protein